MLIIKAVVTGSSGFIGIWLINELMSNNIKVIALVRDENKVPANWKLNERLELIRCSLDELSLIEPSTISNDGVDLFYHLAWDGTSGVKRSDVSLQLKNIEYTCEAVRLASKLKCKKFINAGSIMEYEAMQTIPCKDTELSLGNIYSTAKITADFMAKIIALNLNMQYINLVISNIYGPGEKSQRFIISTIKKLLNNERVPLTLGYQLYDFIYVSDAAKAMHLIGYTGKGSTYYIGNVKPKPLKEFVIEMKEAIGGDSTLEFGAIPFSDVILKYEDLKTDRLFEEFGFIPSIGFKEGIINTMNWLLGGEDGTKFYF